MEKENERPEPKPDIDELIFGDREGRPSER